MWRFPALATVLLLASGVTACERHGTGEARPEPTRPSASPAVPAVESPAGGTELAQPQASSEVKADERRKSAEEEKEEEREDESPPEKEEEREK
jgi:hypothetical protein